MVEKKTIQPLYWRYVQDEESYEFIAFGIDRVGLLADVLHHFYDRGAAIYEVHAQQLRDKRARIQVKVELRNLEEAHALQAAVAHVPDIYTSEMRPILQSAQQLTSTALELFPKGPVHEKGDFVGRAIQLNQLRDAFKRGGSIVLHGLWKVGKTSLLQHMAAYDRDDFHALTILIDLRHVYHLTFPDLLWEIVSTLSARLTKETGHLHIYDLALGNEEEQHFQADPMRAFQSYLARVRRVFSGPNAPHIVVMVDEFSELYDRAKAGELESRMFRHLHAIVTLAREWSFVFVVQAAALHEMRHLAEYGAGLLEGSTFIPVTPPQGNALEKLLQHRMKRVGLLCPDEVITEVMAMCGCNPFLVNLLGREMSELVQQRGAYTIGRDILETAVNQLLNRDGDGYLIHLSNGIIQSELEQTLLQTFSLQPDAAVCSIPFLVEAVGQPRNDVERVLEALADKNILLRHLELKETRYALQTPLFGRWVRKQHQQHRATR